MQALNTQKSCCADCAFHSHGKIDFDPTRLHGWQQQGEVNPQANIQPLKTRGMPLLRTPCRSVWNKLARRTGLLKHFYKPLMTHHHSSHVHVYNCPILHKWFYNPKRDQALRRAGLALALLNSRSCTTIWYLAGGHGEHPNRLFKDMSWREQPVSQKTRKVKMEFRLEMRWLCIWPSLCCCKKMFTHIHTKTKWEIGGMAASRFELASGCPKQEVIVRGIQIVDSKYPHEGSYHAALGGSNISLDEWLPHWLYHFLAERTCLAGLRALGVPGYKGPAFTFLWQSINLPRCCQVHR